MARDEVLQRKDRVQKALWRQGGRTVPGYTALVREKAKKLRKSGRGLKYARHTTPATK